MRDYTKIRAWELADNLVVSVYAASRPFPKEEIYGLQSQLRRAVVSVPTNICEGATRHTHRDYLHFLYIARASLSETQYLIHLCARLGYLQKAEAEKLQALVTEVFRCLHGLICSVEKEAGRLSKATALFTSFVVVGLFSWAALRFPVGSL